MENMKQNVSGKYVESLRSWVLPRKKKRKRNFDLTYNLSCSADVASRRKETRFANPSNPGRAKSAGNQRRMLAINLSARPGRLQSKSDIVRAVVPGMDNQRNDVGRRTKSQRESRSASVSLPDCPTDRNMIRLGNVVSQV